MLLLPVSLQPKLLPEVLTTIITLERPLFGVLSHVTLKVLDNSCSKIAKATLKALLSLVGPLVNL